MKKLMLLLVVLCTGIHSYAISPIKFGIKAGTTFSDFSATKKVGGGYDLDVTKNPGFQLGVVSRINLLLLHIQPELIYSSTTQTVGCVENGQQTTSKVKYNSFDLPVLAGMKFLIFRVNAGPVFNLMSQSTVKDAFKSGFNSVDMAKNSVSYMVGAGLDLWKLNVDLRYHGYFSPSIQNIIGMGSTAFSNEFKSDNYVLSVGYMF